MPGDWNIEGANQSRNTWVWLEQQSCNLHYIPGYVGAGLYQPEV